MKDDNIKDSFYLQIQGEINRIEKKADTYVASFYFIRILQIILTGTITVLSGLNTNDNKYSLAILLLSTAVTLITAIDTLFQTDNKKNTYKLVLFELRSIRAEVVHEYIQAKTINGEKEISDVIKKELFEKYRKVNSYARDLIGSDKEKEPSKIKVPPLKTN